MCLVVDVERTEACREVLRAEGGARMVYKFLRLRGADLELVGPCARDWVWKPGWHEADGAIPSGIFTGMQVGGGGFRAYFDPPSKTGFESIHSDGTVVPFWAFERDFLCAGAGDPAHVLFRRLYLDPGDYELSRTRILQKLKEERPRSKYSSLYFSPEKLGDGIRRCSGRLSRLLSSRPRPEPPFDLDVVHHGVKQLIETRRAERALVDVTPSASEPTDAPIFWIHEAKHPLPTRSGRRIGRSIPLHAILGVPVTESDPLSAA